MFLNINISQGSVAKHFRCAGWLLFVYLLLNVSMNYRHFLKSSDLFFEVSVRTGLPPVWTSSEDVACQYSAT